MSTDNAGEGLRAKFWQQVETGPETKCWPWLGPVSDEGYGRIYVGDGRTRGAHRVSYELSIGVIPEGLVIDHLCRNRACVNPDHLEPVTRTENVRRGVAAARKRAKTECVQGHAMTPENTFVDNRGGWRGCRECRRAASLRYVHKKRGAPKGAAK